MKNGSLWALQTYQSSSPSYLLMASIAKCFEYVKTEESFSAEHFVKNLNDFYKKTDSLQKLETIRCEKMDLSKIVISTARTELTGQQLEELLLERYGVPIRDELWQLCVGDGYNLRYSGTF